MAICIYCKVRIHTETGTFLAKNSKGQPCHLVCREQATEGKVTPAADIK